MVGFSAGGRVAAAISVSPDVGSGVGTALVVSAALRPGATALGLGIAPLSPQETNTMVASAARHQPINVLFIAKVNRPPGSLDNREPAFTASLYSTR